MRPTTSRCIGVYTLNITGGCEGDSVATITGNYGKWKVCSECDREKLIVYLASAIGKFNP
jgi:hypothetical protein